MGKDNHDQRDGAESRSYPISKNDILAMIGILRSVTKIMKVSPFLYAAFIIMCAPLYFFCEDSTISVIDNLFYISPIVMFLFIIMSYQLKFCKWYRLQCVLPFLPQGLGLVDTYVYEFGENVTYVLLLLYGIIFLLSILNTYFVFIKKPGLRRQGS